MAALRDAALRDDGELVGASEPQRPLRSSASGLGPLCPRLALAVTLPFPPIAAGGRCAGARPDVGIVAGVARGLRAGHLL